MPIRIAGASDDVSGLFNVGSGRAQTWLELMGALYAAAGTDLKVEWTDVPIELRGPSRQACIRVIWPSVNMTIVSSST